MNNAAIATASDGPLTQQHYHELALAHGRAQKVRKAAGVAKFNGWTTAVFAALSVPFALSSLAGFVVTIGLSVVAYNEFRGRKRLLKFDPSSPALLGWNQVGLLTFIIGYCTWMLFAGLTSAGSLAAEIAAQPELRAAVGSFDEFDHLYRMLIVVVYGTVIVLSAIFQGLTAFYYFTRRKYVEACIQESPPWTLDLQRLTTPA